MTRCISRLGITCVLCWLVSSVIAPAVQAQSSDYQRGYSTGLMEGRACRTNLPAPGINNSPDFFNGWTHGYQDGRKACQPASNSPGTGGTQGGSGGGGGMLGGSSNFHVAAQGMRLHDAAAGKSYQDASLGRNTGDLKTPGWRVMGSGWRKSNATSVQYVTDAPFQLSPTGVISGTPRPSDAGYTFDVWAEATGVYSKSAPQYDVFITVPAPNTACNPSTEPFYTPPSFAPDCALGPTQTEICDPNLPKDAQYCRYFPQPTPNQPVTGGTPANGGGNPATAPSANSGCNPNMPAYTQPGCHSGGAQTSGVGTLPAQPSSGGTPDAGGNNTASQPSNGGCNPNMPAYAQPGCHAGGTQISGGQNSPAPQACNPNLPSYAQPGCRSGSTSAPSGGVTAPATPPAGGCNPNLPAYAQPGCRTGGQTSGGGQYVTPGLPVAVPTTPPAIATVDSCDAANPLFAGHSSPLTGIWYVSTSASTEETWEFFGDSMWRHTWITGGSGAITRTSERGRFQLSGNRLTLHVTSQSGGYASSGAIGGGTTCKDELRQSTLQVLGNTGDGGLVLDGVQLKFRSH